MSGRRGERWTGTFSRLAEEKKARILQCATREFARAGYAGANVNAIAAEAGISVGSLYQYFRSKEDLFLALVESFHELLERSIGAILAAEPRFFGRVRALLREAATSAARDPDSVRVYIACTTEELAPLATRLSDDIEQASAGPYARMVREGQAAGEVDPGLDPGWAAFFLDDLLLLVQYSFASGYYRERLRLFTGLDLGDPALAAEEAVTRLSEFVERALAPRRAV